MRGAPAIAGGRYIPRFHKNVNARDAFSHSAECDEAFSVVSDLPGGAPHKDRCWCHNTQELYTGPNGFEYDLAPPPEYANSADAAFPVAEPDALPVILIEPAGLEKDFALEWESDSVIDTQAASLFPNRSQRERTSGLCDTCGEKLDTCECVE